MVAIVLLININEAVKSSQSNNNHNKNIITINNYTSNIALNNIVSAPSISTVTTNVVSITKPKKKKIGYAITVTKDGHFVDGALVLGYSALKVHDESKGFHSEYEAELIAFVVPTVIEAR